MIRHSLAVMAAPTLATFALATTAFTPVASQAAEIEIEAEGPVIELSIYESVTTEPDLVTIGAGVSTEAPTAVEALRRNAEEMQRVVDQILALGVAEEDIQTTGINLNARYDYDRDNQRQVFRGYEVSNRVSVKLRDIEGTGAALDALVQAGATDLSGPSFSIEDDEASKDVARQRAFERARVRALQYAQMVGFDDIRVLSISEVIQARGPVAQPELRSRASLASDAPPTSPVQPGQVSTGVNITVKFEMVGADAAAGPVNENVSS